MSECAICGRDTIAGNEYCGYHEEALKNIKVAFDNWNQAFEIDWDTYLGKLLDEENIGKWAREMVDHLTQQDDSSESP